ncbi:MAG: spore coat associated protein CotJA [Clostridia bacterium]|nr:spore coat associated protein CotJA [Clostridia bacterium]
MNEYGGYRYPQQRQIHRRDTCHSSITPLPSNYTVAMLYVPMQTDTTMFEEMKAFECGTLFSVLNKPFAGKCCK